MAVELQERGADKIRTVALDDLNSFDLSARPVWVWSFDTDSVPWANRAALQWFGVADLAGMDLGSDYEATEGSMRRLASFQQQLTQHHTVTDIWTIFVDGAPRSLRVVGSALTLTDKPEAGACALIEGEPLASEEAREEVVRQVRFLQHSELMVSVFTMQGQVLLMNPAAEAVYGADPGADGKGGSAFLRRFADDREGARCLAALGREERYSDDVQVQTLDGKRWHRVFAWIDRDPVSGEKSIFVEERDTTATRAIEEQMLRITKAVESSSDAVSIVGREGDAVYVNSAFTDLFGYGRVQLNELGGIERLFPDKQAARDVMRAIRKGVAWTGELSVKSRSGRELPIDLRIDVITDAGGRSVGQIMIYTDITLRKQHEEELRKAKEEAEAANQAKSDFLATMSHEIRTPMNGIIGMTGLLLDSGLPSDQRAYAEIVRDSGESLLTIINDILDFSKMEAGRLDLEIIDFNLINLAENVVELLAARAYAQGLEIVADIDTGIDPYFQGDPGRLRQILLNLAGNAVKFTEKGSVRLKITPVDKDDLSVASLGQWLRFDVIDSGIGIPPDRQEKLFSKFTQADSSISRKYGGTGLGLAICKKLVEMMGGEIGVTSVIGEGSTFWFEIPLSAGDVPRGETDVDSSVAQGVRILVVDDDENNAAVLMNQYRLWGAHVDHAGGAMKALKTLAVSSGDQAYDVLVIDRWLSGVDGEELARRIRAHPLHGGTAMVLMAPHTNRPDAARLAQTGFRGVLPKPVTRRGMVLALSAALGREEQKSADQPREIALASVSARVLVAEDNHVNQKLATALLERVGHRVDVAGNGREAVEAVRALPYDIVLMDMQMPVMDGLEATAAIRALPGTASRTPIVALTANAMDGHAEQCLAAGMDDYLSKPINPDKLYGMIEKYTGDEAMPDPIDTEPPKQTAAPVLDHPIIAPEEFLDESMPLIDDETLGNLMKLVGSENVAELLIEFRNEATTHRDQIAAAQEALDWAAMGRAAHSLKGIASNLGVVQLADCSRLMMEAVKAGEHDRATNLQPRIDMLVDWSIKGLKGRYPKVFF